MSRLLSGIVILGAVAAFCGYLLRDHNLDKTRQSAQTILDRIPGNALMVTDVAAPTFAFIPLIGPAEWDSFLYLADKSGKELDQRKCPISTDYRMRLSDRRMLVRVLLD